MNFTIFEILSYHFYYQIEKQVLFRTLTQYNLSVEKKNCSGLACMNYKCWFVVDAGLLLMLKCLVNDFKRGSFVRQTKTHKEKKVWRLCPSWALGSDVKASGLSHEILEKSWSIISWSYIRAEHMSKFENYNRHLVPS